MAVMGIGMRASHNDLGPGRPEEEGSELTDRWDEVAGPGRPHRRRHRRRLSPEQRAYRVAQRRANLKLSFMIHFVVYLSVCVMLLFVAGFRPMFYTALGWGVAIAVHWFVALVAPGLRRRFIEHEVSREVHRNVTRERRSIEDRHARSLEQLSASIAHEIRNPITAAKSLVQQMGEDPASHENVEYANVALSELDRVERSISHLLRFAREEDLQVRAIRLRDVVESALDTFRDRIDRMNVSLQSDIGTDGAMDGDPEKLRRVILNLVGNALDALEQQGTPNPEIEVMAGENLAGSEVWVRIRDNGPGIEPEALNKIFSPFYTSKPNGTGLGLAISKKLVDAHGGTIEANSSPGSGTEFLITFPKQAGQNGTSA
jgi:signal transduction histidine kinase